MMGAIIKSAIVLALAGCVAVLLRRKSAALRHTIWTAGLMGALAIPLFSITLPSWPNNIAGGAAALIGQVAERVETFRRIAVATWLAGAAVGMFFLLYGAARLAWVAIRSEPLHDDRWAALAEEVRRRLGIRRQVRLLQNRSTPFLGTWGIMVPRVLLPPTSENWSDDRIRMVLSHELAHIKRHDWFVQVLAEAARAIYWFNPIFWLACSRLRRESEQACDDAVVRLGAGGAQYAEELLAMTRDLRSLRSPILAMAQPSHLEQRLVALLNPSLNRLAATPWAVILVAALAVGLTLPLAAVRSPEPSPTPAVAELRDDVTVQKDLRISHYDPLSPETGRGSTPDERRPLRIESGPVATRPALRETTIASRNQPQEPERDLPNPIISSALPPTVQPVREAATVPEFECNVTQSLYATKATREKSSFGNGPWFINEDRTIWAADLPYVAGRQVSTLWLRPADSELMVTGRRLDRDAPQLVAQPAATYSTTYLALGLTFPEPGCWEVTGAAGDRKLTFITRVRE